MIKKIFTRHMMQWFTSYDAVKPSFSRHTMQKKRHTMQNFHRQELGLRYSENLMRFSERAHAQDLGFGLGGCADLRKGFGRTSTFCLRGLYD